MTIDELLEKLHADRTEHWTHEIGAPLDDAELAAWHAEHGLTIPDDLLAVLRRANGIRFNVDATGRSTLGKDLLPLRDWKPAYRAWGVEPHRWRPPPSYVALTNDVDRRAYVILDTAEGTYFTVGPEDSQIVDPMRDVGELMSMLWRMCVGATDHPDARNGSRLFYPGTKDELRLGDRVRRKRWLRKPAEGVVAYLPGCQPRHPDLHSEDGAAWLIRWGEGFYTEGFYSPETIPLEGNIELVSRGTVEPIPVTERIA